MVPFVDAGDDHIRVAGFSLIQLGCTPKTKNGHRAGLVRLIVIGFLDLHISRFAPKS